MVLLCELVQLHDARLKLTNREDLAETLKLLEGARVMLTTCITRFSELAAAYKQIGYTDIAVSLFVLAEDAETARKTVLKKVVKVMADE